MSEALLRRILIPVTILVLLAYYLFFVAPGLKLYFDNDDMMNLYFAWSRPLLQSYRPLGALFYRVMFAEAGFDPLPFRFVCITLGAINMGLCFWFVRLATESNRIAALAVLLFAFHSRMMEVWYRTAVIYDLLCFAFFYLAACLYMRQRNAAALVCFIAALGAKENAVALPVVLLTWDLLNRRFLKSYVPLICGLIDIPYLWFKTHGSGALAQIEPYQSQFTLNRFAHTWALYLNYIFLRQDGILPWMALAILAVLLAIAFRSKNLLFAWVILFAPVLPVAFLEFRGAFVLYTSYPGWALYAATVLVSLQNLVRVHRTALACAVFVLVGWRWGKINLHDQRIDPAKPWLYQSPIQVRQLADALPALAPQLRVGTRCLFLNDAFSTEEWTPYFIMKLFYRDDTLVADRAKMMTTQPSPGDYQFVFTYENGQYRRLKP